MICNSYGFSSSNGVLLRRHENNLGPEESLDLSDENIEADDEDGTLVRGTGPKNGSSHYFRSSKSRVNGTSENSSDQTKEFGVHKILEKGKASLSRSKSELGEQHKKMISHWKFSKNELTEQNRKLLANLGSGLEKTSKKLLPGSFKKSKDSPTSEVGGSGQNLASASKHESSKMGNFQPNNNGLETVEPQDLDGLMKNLGLEVHPKRPNIQPAVVNSSMSKSLYVTEYNDLEKHLENDYGEFEFIDEGGTLTRSLKTNGEAVNTEEHRKSMFSFSEEVFDELEKAGTLRPASKNPALEAEKPKTPETYETYGAWRQKRKDSQSSGYVSQYYSQYQNNNNSVTNNTSAKLSALIADQTLLLRHHKRRKKAAEKIEKQVNLEDPTKDHMQESLLALQAQLESATKQLEGSSYNSVIVTTPQFQPLRRCSSLSQTYNEDDYYENPPAKVNGTSPLSSSPWLSSQNNSCRYLYRGKFQPASNSNSMNNNSNHNTKNGPNGPWQLRSNLSSFARRRRGSSTSLHTFSDNEDESNSPIVTTTQTNGYHNGTTSSTTKKRQKIPDADSVSLTGADQPSHR